MMHTRYDILKFENIRKLRIDNGYTQEEIAKLLNIKKNTYSQYEVGTLNYPVDALMVLADFYHVSVDYLLGRTTSEIRWMSVKQLTERISTDTLRFLSPHWVAACIEYVGAIINRPGRSMTAKRTLPGR